jgi:broad specificity phosphatase PhoE
MPLKRLILIRAGETDWNLLGRFQGWVATPLNEHGRQQATRLANFVRNIGLSALYSSDNRRALETAQILVERLDFDMEPDKRLRERSIGLWQGLTVPEIHGWYPEAYAEFLADPDNYKIAGGGESVSDVRARVKEALDEIINKADKEPGNVAVGVVTHTTAIRVILMTLLPDQDMRRQNFGNTSVTTVRRNEDGTWTLITVDDLMHLEGLASRYMPEVRGSE